MTILDYVESKLKTLAKQIIEGGDKLDELCAGELGFYMSLRRVLKKKATPYDIGLMDAVNDVLQFLGKVDKKKTFLK